MYKKGGRKSQVKEDRLYVKTKEKYDRFKKGGKFQVNLRMKEVLRKGQCSHMITVICIFLTPFLVLPLEI